MICFKYFYVLCLCNSYCCMFLTIYIRFSISFGCKVINFHETLTLCMCSSAVIRISLIHLCFFLGDAIWTYVRLRFVMLRHVQGMNVMGTSSCNWYHDLLMLLFVSLGCSLSQVCTINQRADITSDHFMIDGNLQVFINDFNRDEFGALVFSVNKRSYVLQITKISSSHDSNTISKRWNEQRTCGKSLFLQCNMYYTIDYSYHLLGNMKVCTIIHTTMQLLCIYCQINLLLLILCMFRCLINALSSSISVFMTTDWILICSIIAITWMSCLVLSLNCVIVVTSVR